MLRATITHIRAFIARHRFAKATRPWDERIQKARAQHAPVRAIQAEKRQALHRALEAGR